MPDETEARAAGSLGAAEFSSETTGLAAGTPVLTLDGELPVEHLCPGDCVITRDGARKLRAVHSRTCRDIAVVQVSPRALGHDRPESPLTLLPGQGVLLRDWRAKALYGVNRAMVAAARLVDGAYMRIETASHLRLFILDLGAPAVIYAGHLELAVAPVRANA